MRRVIFDPENYYHIYNRGVDKRDIFIDDSDYYRFIHDLYEFNDKDAAPSGSYRGSASVINSRKKRKLLVDIVCFCLMPNHYHLILRPRKKEGVTKFMQKLGTGYTMYFNKKNERTGSLFGNRFRAILIEEENYLTHLSRYIHLNPVELQRSSRGTKRKGLDWRAVCEFLQGYKWSSYPDYIGKHNFPSVIDNGIVMDYFEAPEQYKDFVIEDASKEDALIEDMVISE